LLLYPAGQAAGHAGELTRRRPRPVGQLDLPEGQCNNFPTFRQRQSTRPFHGRIPISIFNTIADTLKASTALLAISINTIVLTLTLCVLAIPKWLAPAGPVRDFFRRELAKIAELWISINNLILSLYRQPEWDLEIPDNLDRKGCYLVSCNHRSWVDILVLQRCFNRRLPLLRFFLKRELIRVPFLGMAWWALDFPFMRRDSKSELARRPGLKGRDLESARKACEKFRNIPVAMMNFPEGTRFTERKRDASKSPFRNLLLPRIGGMGQVLYALGDQLDALIDVTIVYPQVGQTASGPTFWDLLSGRVPRIVARAERRDIPAHLLGRDFRADPQFRRDLEAWMTQMWEEKDALIDRLLSPRSGAPTAA
jgi:1-acyl-sn-glycerol-3-phosphate acyltransferase